MELIPVMDLRQGLVVHARQGQRDAYRPVDSPLCRDPRPSAVAQALLSLTVARRVYVADLDGILDARPQAGLLQALMAAWPAVEWWIDAGLRDADDADRLAARLGPAGERWRPVFGTESLRGAAALADLAPWAARGVLSLDRRAGQAMDPAGVWSQPAVWWPRTIVMTLERVGSGAGPDLLTLPALRAQAPQVRCWVGSGGVRSPADLADGAATGASAWLVASALHAGGWPPAD